MQIISYVVQDRNRRHVIMSENIVNIITICKHFLLLDKLYKELLSSVQDGPELNKLCLNSSATISFPFSSSYYVIYNLTQAYDYISLVFTWIHHTSHVANSTKLLTQLFTAYNANIPLTLHNEALGIPGHCTT